MKKRLKKQWKRLLAGALSAVMLAAVLPAPAYAAVGTLVRNSALENSALMQALEEAYGQDAEAYMSLLRSYGLVDARGNLITDEEIVVDGVSYTLDELEEYLVQPGLDQSTVATVDGVPITLGELKTVLEIERYLAYIQATYFTRQELNADQIESFYDLADAWANGDVQLLSSAPITGTGPAGIDHSVELEVTAGLTAEEKGTYTVTVQPSAPQSQDITFSWRALSGSAEAEGQGNETISAGSTDPVSFQVQVDEVQGQTSGSGTFLVQIYDVKNALFPGGADCWEQSVSVDGQMEYAYQFDGTGSLASEPTEFYYYLYEDEHIQTDFIGDSDLETYEKEFIRRTESLTFDLPDFDPAGTYDGDLKSTLSLTAQTTTKNYKKNFRGLSSGTNCVQR